VSAADLLRTALDDAPTMRVEEDAYRDLAVWDHNDDFVLGNYSAEGQVALRLVGLLLAAAPHLADLLDGLAMTGDKAKADAAYLALRQAITEAGESL